MQSTCFTVLPGNAEAQVTWGGIVTRVLIAYFIRNISAKKYDENQFTWQSYIKPKLGRFVRHDVHAISGWTRVGPKNHVLDMGPNPTQRGKGVAHCKVQGFCAVRELCKNSCTDRDAVWDAALGAAQPGTTWQIRLSRPCAAAMLPYVKLLWRHVNYGRPA